MARDVRKVDGADLHLGIDEGPRADLPEGEAQVAAFLKRTPGIQRTPITSGEGGSPEASLLSTGDLRILPHHRPGGTDGFFAARFHRSAE